jgi:hypothetical protein
MVVTSEEIEEDVEAVGVARLITGTWEEVEDEMLGVEAGPYLQAGGTML